MTEILTMALAAYALTFLATMSRAGEYIWREPIRQFTRGIFRDRPEIIAGIDDFLECRMCSGFWIALIVVIAAGNLSQFLPVYGLAYFLATQERD
jgi:hypothetical protein